MVVFSQETVTKFFLWFYQEEIMRIERESIRSTKSLTEELQAVKDNSRAERQSVVQKLVSCLYM